MAMLLQERPAGITMNGMATKPTEQVRIPTNLAEDARTCAHVLHGESLPEYVGRVLRDAVARDLPKAAKKIAERVNRPADSEGRK